MRNISTFSMISFRRTSKRKNEVRVRWNLPLRAMSNCLHLYSSDRHIEWKTTSNSSCKHSNVDSFRGEPKHYADSIWRRKEWWSSSFSYPRYQMETPTDDQVADRLRQWSGTIRCWLHLTNAWFSPRSFDYSEMAPTWYHGSMWTIDDGRATILDLSLVRKIQRTLHATVEKETSPNPAYQCMIDFLYHSILSLSLSARLVVLRFLWFCSHWWGDLFFYLLGGFS